jgi:hypothetical protein
MIFLSRVEVGAGAFAVGHRAIAEFMNVEAVLARLQPGEFGDDFHAVIFLREGYLAFHPMVAEAVHHGDGVRNSFPAGACSRRTALGPFRFRHLRSCLLELHRDNHQNQCRNNSHPGSIAHEILLC